MSDEKKNPFEKKGETPWETARKEFEKRERKKNASGSLIKRILITLAFAAVYFYVALPALNPQSGDLYAFILLALAVFVGLTVLGTGLYRSEDPAGDIAFAHAL